MTDELEPPDETSEQGPREADSGWREVDDWYRKHPEETP